MKLMQSIVKNAGAAVNNTSQGILQNHLSSFMENNLNALMTDYSNESVLITPDASYTGLEEIEGFFIDLMSHFPKKKSIVELDKTVIDDELVYIVWHGKTPSLEVSFATDTFIIKNSKILRQTFAGQLKSVGKL